MHHYMKEFLSQNVSDFVCLLVSFAKSIFFKISKMNPSAFFGDNYMSGILEESEDKILDS